MDMAVLLFAVLFALSAVIAARVISNKGERQRKAEEDVKQRAEEKGRQQLEEKRHKAEEEHKRLEDKAQQKAKEEEKKRLADKLQKAKEERKRVEEEKRHRAQEEEQRRKAEKEAQGKVVNPKKRVSELYKKKNTLKQRKPHKKKVPTEERKRELIKPKTTEGKRSSPKQRELIYLGDTQRWRRRLTGAQRKFQSDENIDKEITDKTPEEKKIATTVESPFVEIDIDNANVCLILPQQQFRANTVGKTSQQLSYRLELNGDQQEVPVKTTINRGGRVVAEEGRICLEKPLVKFQVAFPDELRAREYNYNHRNKELYVFVAIGNNRGRMYYLYNKDGKINPLPKRIVWILIYEEFGLQTLLGPGDITEDRWIWEKYQPFRVDLSEIDSLTIKNRKSGVEKSFSLRSTFRVEGEQLVEDDFKKECPLFTDKTLKIIAPYKNLNGWNAWIQNKVAGFRVKKNWTGNKPLTLSCAEDLPCDCGEFQIDICQQDTRLSEETLFFRRMPSIELDYPKELIVPNPKSGHTHSTISVKLDSNDEWELKHKEGRNFEPMQRNFYQIELPPKEDTFRFYIVKTNRPETIVNFQVTIPRLKWKTSKQNIWDSKFQKIERRSLKPGEPFYFLIQTNDFDNKYDLLAVLETNGQKLQEGRFIRKGVEYSLELNQFYDTIRQYKNELNLKVEIWKIRDNQLLSKVNILNFVPPLIHCKHLSCSFETHGIENMMSHFEKYHFHSSTEHLTYEELKEYDEMLPHAIYKCSYCNFYSREDDPRNPTSLICQHIKKNCPEGGRISFRVISNIDEIRQYVIPNLAHIDKCKLCGIHFKDYSWEEKVEHFFEKHENEICEYSER